MGVELCTGNSPVVGVCGKPGVELCTRNSPVVGVYGQPGVELCTGNGPVVGVCRKPGENLSFVSSEKLVAEIFTCVLRNIYFYKVCYLA
jgi:hypothetical protein